jgi:hypothetical protein
MSPMVGAEVGGETFEQRAKWASIKKLAHLRHHASKRGLAWRLIVPLAKGLRNKGKLLKHNVQCVVEVWVSECWPFSDSPSIQGRWCVFLSTLCEVNPCWIHKRMRF